MNKLSYSGLSNPDYSLRVFLWLFFFVIGTLFIKNTALCALPNCSTTGSESTDQIFFTDGQEQYIYTLEELALARMRVYERGVHLYNQIYCTNPTILSQKLFILSQKVNKPAVDAKLYLDEQGQLQIIPEQYGQKLDLSLLIISLGNPSIYKREYPLPIRQIPPQVKSENLQAGLPNDLWTEYTTVLTNIPDRTENVRVASQKLNSCIIAPKTVLSFNETVGPREPELGYRTAQIIVAGKFESGLGGGVCQVSSTLYNTVLLTGLDIIERYNHSVRIGYVPLGRDATVVYGQKDLKFYNNTGSYLMIRTDLTGLKLTISIYGCGAKPYDQVDLYTNIIKTIPFQEDSVSDNSLPPGESKILVNGTTGYYTETYRVITNNGEKKDEVISRDFYSPVKAVRACGPKLNDNN